MRKYPLDDETVIARLKAKTRVTETNCWVWLGSLNGKGYGNIWIGRKLRYTHRVGYTVLRGPIPSELEIDHLCHNTSCWNPDHLEPVTHLENMRRSRKVKPPKPTPSKKTLRSKKPPRISLREFFTKVPVKDHLCAQCSKPFNKTRPWHKYCSDYCRLRQWLRPAPADKDPSHVRLGEQSQPS